ncbi:Fur family transcriptional regulator [Pseudalkalibacillus salsuginis]|uniref:Fur family transcriptional regulator n=1 Tax=Pseudalkalibacillus salsuginis TaxID=2910972 RepID=UPI001F3E7115|nr:Fur family transcriptional regulator [Pseudalkalibacillus salsuginis]MCF6408500.1 transcriptional repressor [Pseudalkalibacillus salsuginis]
MNVSEALDILKENGYKHTTKREMFLELFSNERRYLTAKDVLEYMKPSYPGLSFDTIYRNLSVFTELGIVEETELDGEKHFRFSCSTKGHHHHMICLQCGKTNAIEACPMKDITPDEFMITDHKFEIYGYCQECQ